MQIQITVIEGELVTPFITEIMNSAARVGMNIKFSIFEHKDGKVVFIDISEKDITHLSRGGKC